MEMVRSENTGVNMKGLHHHENYPMYVEIRFFRNFLKNLIST